MPSEKADPRISRLKLLASVWDTAVTFETSSRKLSPSQLNFLETEDFFQSGYATVGQFPSRAGTKQRDSAGKIKLSPENEEFS